MPHGRGEGPGIPKLRPRRCDRSVTQATFRRGGLRVARSGAIGARVMPGRGAIAARMRRADLYLCRYVPPVASATSFMKPFHRGLVFWAPTSTVWIRASR
jgi:hypothetical protein